MARVSPSPSSPQKPLSVAVAEALQSESGAVPAGQWRTLFADALPLLKKGWDCARVADWLVSGGYVEESARDRAYWALQRRWRSHRKTSTSTATAP